MMKELRNVLTVRTTSKTSLKVKRTRKMKSKHVKKKDKVLSQSNQTSDQLSKDMPDGNVTEKCTATLPDTQQSQNETADNVKYDVSLTMTSYDTKEDVSHDTEDNNAQDTLHGVPNDGESCHKLMMENANPIMMRHVATMAAKIALKQSAGSNKQEEVFGSEH